MHAERAVAIAMQSARGSGNRQDRRKAATRRKILTASERLFGSKGYASTSIEDISEAADVAVRTIYMHFSSKAAMMLAGFDAWVDLFVDGILRRPVDEPVVDTVRIVLEEISAAGWDQHPEGGEAPAHPMVEHLSSGSPDIAGYVLQRWMREMSRIARDAADRGAGVQSVGSLEPQARAVAFFAAWIGALSAASGGADGIALPPESTGHTLGIEVLRILTAGDL